MGDSKRRQENDPNYGKKEHRLFDVRPNQSRGAFENLPPGTSAQDYLNYLDRNWDLMAGFAYQMYLNEGRGALILDWDLSLDAQVSLLSPDLRKRNHPDAVISNRELNCPIFYLGDRGLLSRDWLTSDRRRLIQQYDPETMIVLFLSWGVTPGRSGNIMGRTLALAGGKSPKQLYVENADRQREFSFLSGSDEAPPPAAPESRAIRAFYAEIESSPEFRRSLKKEFVRGFQAKGKGAIVVIPMPERDSVMPIFVPVAELPQALGADVQSSPYQQLLSIMDMCNPQTQVAAIAVSEEVRTGENFTYYSCLLNIPEGV